MNKRIYPYYFVVGAVLLYLVFMVIPGVTGILFSFTDWSSYSTSIHFTGLANFKQIFAANSGGNSYLTSIVNTVIFTLVTTLAKTALGLAFAILLTSGIKLQNFHRAVIFLPAILSMLITGLVFKSIFDPASGVLNMLLKTVGLGFLQQQWLTNIKIAFGSIMVVDTWKGVGYIMTIILAGLQSIDRSYYEAAGIDGASFWAKLRFITIPLIMPSLMISTVLNLLYGLKVFDVVFVLTNGGPGYATEVLGTSVYDQFSQGNYAISTAMNSLLCVFMVVVGVFVIRVMSRQEVES
jgi:raffinose/stachyose/melibiose transport system permease protein